MRVDQRLERDRLHARLQDDVSAIREEREKGHISFEMAVDLINDAKRDRDLAVQALFAPIESTDGPDDDEIPGSAAYRFEG